MDENTFWVKINTLLIPAVVVVLFGMGSCEHRRGAMNKDAFVECIKTHSPSECSLSVKANN